MQTGSGLKVLRRADLEKELKSCPPKITVQLLLAGSVHHGLGARWGSGNKEFGGNFTTSLPD
jgi:hypothetical protein